METKRDLRNYINGRQGQKDRAVWRKYILKNGNNERFEEIYKQQERINGK